MKAICFDALGTLINIGHINQFLEVKYPNFGSALGSLWRTKQIDYTRLRAMSNHYKPFDEITQDALVASLDELSLSWTPSDVDVIMSTYSDAVAFPDVTPFLNSLSTPWSIVTNANRSFIRPILRSAEIGIADSHLLTSDQVQTFKTIPALYQLGWGWAQSQGATSLREVLFVSSNQWDAIGAAWFGFTTCWVNRRGQTADQLDTRPDFVVSDFKGLEQFTSDSA
jgi:2-haloacid dehalogenase